MKKSLCHFALWLFVVLSLTACGRSSPEGVAKDFFQAVAENRIDDALILFDTRDIEKKKSALAHTMYRAVTREIHNKFERQGGLKRIETKILSQNENLAHVEISLTMADGSTDTRKMDLIKREDGWKIKIF